MTQTEQTYGLCGCGCGRRTRISKVSNATRGLVKGQPIRFIHGHNHRISLVEGKAWEVVDLGYKTPCWRWLRGGGSGYGQVMQPDGERLAHRAVYRQFKGEIPQGLQLDHLCRNRGCVNPDHLEPVTCAENLRRGCRTKLTADDVREIRASPASGAEMARRFGMSTATISQIRTRKRWRDLD